VIKGDIEDPVVPLSPYWIVKSVMWLCLQTQKPILRLTYNDYEDYHLSGLVIDCANGSVEDLNLYCYKKIIKKITGGPLGNRPQHSDET
jgi:glucosamine-6-phosphate deaminase